MSVSRSPSLGNINGYDEDFDSFHHNTTANYAFKLRLLINGNEIIDNDVDIWIFMRTFNSYSSRTRRI